MSIKIICYSIKEVFGVPTLSLDLTQHIKEVVHNEYLIIDLPGMPSKRFNWYAYVNRSHIYDDGKHVLFLADYKKIDRKFALAYLLKYLNSDRPNCKDHRLKKPIKVDYKTFIKQ